MSVEQNKALMRRFYEEGWSKGTLEAGLAVIRAYCAPDMADDLRAFATMFYAAFPDAQWTLDDVLAEGDKVAVRFTLRGTHQGVYQGTAPTGRQVTVSGVELDRIADGKIIEMFVGWNELDLVHQLGGAVTAQPPPA
jgi:predicted ester cyclase